MALSVDEKLIKKVGDKDDVPLTPDQAAEWLKCANDKYYFFEKYCFIQASKGKENFHPREYQKRIIDTSNKNRLTVAIVGRQAGKCCLAETKTNCKIINNGIEYNLELSMGDLHKISKCKSPADAEILLKKLFEDFTNEQKRKSKKC